MSVTLFPVPVRPRPARQPGPPLTPEQSIALLERTHGSALRRYLVRLTGDFQRAEDIYQETLIRAWKHPGQRDAHGHYARAWLLTVARRISIDYLRAAATRPAEVNGENLPARHAVQDATETVLNGQVLRTALGALPGQYRQVIYHMYFLDQPATEIARRLGIPLGTVKSRAHYAVRLLRGTLAEPELDAA